MKSFKNFISRFNFRRMAVIYAILFIGFLGLNLFYLNVGTVGGDLPPQGAVLLEQGFNSTVYRLDDYVYKIMNNGDTVTRDNMLRLHNSLADSLGGDLIPKYESVGSNTLRQPFVGGLTWEQLPNDSIREIAGRNAEAIERQAGRAAGQVWSGETRPQPLDRVYLLEDGSFAQIDSTRGVGNYKFNPDGSIFKWYDPVLIGDRADLTSLEERGAKPVVLPPKTDMPIDNGEKLKIALDPTATGASNLKSIKTFTFLSGAMAVAGFALVLNDYKNQYNAATNDEDRNKAGSTFLKTVGTILGFTVAAGVTIAVASSIAPLLGVATLVAFTGIGAVGLGTHIHATFGNEILGLWDMLAGRAPIKPDANHPMYGKLKEYQNQQLQLQLKRMANADNRTSIEFKDVARVAVIMDPSFKQTFVSIPTTTPTPTSTPGFFISDLREKELYAFRTMVNVYHEMLRTPNRTQADVKRWADDIWKIPVKDLYTGQMNSGIAMNYPVSFGHELIKKFQNKVGPNNYNLTFLGMDGKNWSETNNYLALGGPNMSDRISHKAKPVKAGTIVSPVTGVAPSFALTPIAIPLGKYTTEDLMNDPHLINRVGSGPVPLKTGSVVMIPDPQRPGFWCYDTPTEIQFLGNGVVVERRKDADAVGILSNFPVVATEVQPKAGSSSYSSFAFKEVTSNHTYEVNGGMLSCSTAWVAGCGVTEQLPWSPTTGLGGGPQGSYCQSFPEAPGCRCFLNFTSVGCY